jgi:hypothetical protein
LPPVELEKNYDDLGREKFAMESLFYLGLSLILALFALNLFLALPLHFLNRTLMNADKRRFTQINLRKISENQSNLRHLRAIFGRL